MSANLKMITLEAIIAIMIILTFLTRLYKKKHSSKIHPSLPPGPTPLPFFGSIQMFLNRPIFKWIHKLMDQFNTQILCVRVGPSTNVIVVSSPDIACEFLKKQDANFASRPEMLSACLTSDGYRATITSPFGDQWRKMRRILNQNILSPPIHKWLQPKRDEEANHLPRYIYKQIQSKDSTLTTRGGLINIRMVSQHYCGNIIRNMIFGTRFFGKGLEDGGSGNEEIEHVDSIMTILKYIYGFSISDYFPWLRGKIDLDGHEKNIRAAIRGVRKFQDPLVDERIQMWNNGVRKVENDLLDVLVRHDNPKLTTEEIKAQIIDLMLATVDNPSNAVEWVMAEMLNKPEILKRAVEELDNVVGRDRLVEERDLPQLNYIKACLKESFRLHPFVPFNPPRVAITDTIISGYFIPKGSHVLLSRLGLGRNQDVWTNPMEFDPERHLYGDDGNHVVNLSDNSLRILSFSTGKRGCPGVMLGTTITVMLLARLLQGFTWEVPFNSTGIKLVENHDDLSLKVPLIAIAKPRLSTDILLLSF
ncbi:isoleucine N-monooxygenase 1-like [Rutidosis leptorrhynchoides]|uniref:isoleucine N-monooxygenase 1-like n=1 Tax=Rutidosis leptorrhynchoides TaxID=125765 RepID=UPI003A99E54D